MKNPVETAQIKVTRPSMRTMLAVAFALVITIGGSLFFFSEQTETYFAWTIPSFVTAAFLGSAYLAAGLLEVLCARERLWSHSRIAVPAVVVFTALTLVVTLLHLDRFHFNAPWLGTVVGTWVWLAVYASVPLILTALWLRQGHTPGIVAPPAHTFPGVYRLACVLIGLGFAAFGAGLLIAPATVAAYWPWALTPLTARAIGAWMFGWSIALFQIAWENDARRVRPAFISMIALCILQAVSILRYPEFIIWDDARIFVFEGVWVLLLLMSLVGLRRARQEQSDNL